MTTAPRAAGEEAPLLRAALHGFDPDTPARVGVAAVIIDSSICVATMTGLAHLRAARMMRFWTSGTSSRGSSTPRSPLRGPRAASSWWGTRVTTRPRPSSSAWRAARSAGVGGATVEEEAGFMAATVG